MHRLNKEGSQLVTNCNQLKLEAADGKSYLTDVANAETLLRLVRSVPSPKAEPIKFWLAKVGYERMQEIAGHKPADNSQSSNRASRAEAVTCCKSSKGGAAPKFALSFVGIHD